MTGRSAKPASCALWTATLFAFDGERAPRDEVYFDRTALAPLFEGEQTTAA